MKKPKVVIPPKILRCNCVSDFQDTTYGPGMRVFNPAFGQKFAKKGRYRCSGCGVTREV